MTLINHLRTLLLNRPGTPPPESGYPGEEYVPFDYRPVTLPTAAAVTHRLLFGGAPDRAMLNYRLRELTAILHGTELAELVLALDPRITYWPPRPGDWPEGLTVKQFAGDHPSLSFVGPAAPQEQYGRLYAEWQVTVQPDGGVAVDYFDLGASLDRTEVFAPGSVMTLPGSTLRFQTESAPGAAWTIQSLARPTQGLPAVAAVLDQGLSELHVDALFGRDPPEPYRTFRNLWLVHDQTPYRLGGVALALAYRADEIWRGP